MIFGSLAMIERSYRSLDLYLESARNMNVVPIDLFVVNTQMRTLTLGGHDEDLRNYH